MHLLSQRSQAGFHLGMYVFAANSEPAFQGLLTELFQLRQQLCQLIGLQQAHFREHGNMGHGALNVVGGQEQVQFPVLPYGKGVYARVVVKSFIPNLHTLSPSNNCT